MAKKILITGITGFIGHHFIKSIIQKKYELHALIRPSTAHSRYKDIQDHVNLISIDLADTNGLKRFLKNNKFDIIIHIGAIRGGRKFPDRVYYNANVKSTEQFILSSIENKSKLIFCSSVGIFGAIPNELPANNYTEKRNDNYYHYTKIQSEALIQKYVLQGLNAVIVRPSITYGVNDFGFPFRLTQLIDKKMLLLPDRKFMIHLTNIDLLQQAFRYLIDTDVPSGSSFIVADRFPVDFRDLVDFISKELKGKKYSTNRTIPEKYFRLGEKISKKLKNSLWTSRFELLSRSWYYDVENSYKAFGLRSTETIPSFKIVTNWYKNR
ncbi:MAG: NAD(P)-dependent oxidoreductase [Candidatus Cloacimonetes bacterium]|nr:NAD(P)-dependent oxidoreductase [Candidatus Cloacimonadota bacterium]